MASSEQPTSLLTRRDTLHAECPSTATGFGDWVEGQRVGAFKLVRRLGKGGMGAVWLAHQLQPLIRDVALKVMLPERRSARAEAFFEVERQALAQLSHRAIAQIFDAGRLPDGALFFAMEYVPGRPLDEYLRLHPQSLKSLIRMFIELCGGIQHAHQRGLIHRDLKPQNVLVQDTEAGPLPRIIDFGIALGSSADGPTLMQPNQIAGTPAYMAPEQRAPGPAGIDARCDIYALGVMLAECLRQQVGLPFDTRAPESTALREAFVRSLSTRTPANNETTQLRRAPFELRAIALKALAEDREQRYASAASMAEDLQRWLQNEPVLAVAGGPGYTLRCFLRRNAVATAAASLIGLALVGGTGLALYGLTEARAGRAQAEAAQVLAEQRRGEAEQLIQYMLGDFAEKLRPLGRLDLLDSIGAEALKYLGEADIRGDAASALARARALRTLGEVQVTRQHLDQAAPILEQAARVLDEALQGADDGLDSLRYEAGQVAYWRGLLSYRQLDYVSAERHWIRYLSEARSLNYPGASNKTRQQEIAYALNNLGTLMLSQDRPDDAMGNFLEAVSLWQSMEIDGSDPSSIDLADSLSWLANAQERSGLPRSALASRLNALEVLERHAHAVGMNPRIRRYEINARYTLATLGRDLGIGEPISGNLERALELARQDAENDKTQPWRQALLALVAFLSASEAGADQRIASARLQVAERAFEQLDQTEITTVEHLKVKGVRCLELNRDARRTNACARRTLEEMSATQTGWTNNEEMRVLFAQLASRLSHDGRAWQARALEILENLPPENKRSLKFHIALRELLKQLDENHRRLPEINRRIAALSRA